MGTDGTPQFGELLRRHRLAAGLTQEELAERAGLSAHGISDLERGVRSAPRKDTLALLLDALRPSPEERAALLAAARRPAAQRPLSAAALDAFATTPLPVPLTPLIGREREVAALVDLLGQEGVRLVTLTGPGGTGKTRLAIRVTEVLQGEFADGVAFVGLAPISDPTLVLPTVAQALGVRAAAGRPLMEQLADVLRERAVLLILDNFEQVVDAAPHVTDLLTAAPCLRVLVTSRVPLRLSAEHRFPVPPLSLPAPVSSPHLADLAQSEAVDLFIVRAKAVRPDFTLTPANVDAVPAICARLDGLPLAIELAAARVGILPPQALVKRLEQRLVMLTGGARDLPERQQTMRRTIAWSYDLLSPEEQTLFRRLAVFVGGFTLEAAEVVGHDHGGHVSILDGLVSLVESSLVREIGTANGAARYAMLETVREYGLEQLTASGEAGAVRDRHAAWCVTLADQADPLLLRPNQETTLEELEADHPNLRAALDWLEATGAVEPAVRLAGALRWFWLTRGDYREGTDRLERALGLGGAAGVPPAALARALTGLGFLSTMRGDYDQAIAVLTEALALARMAGDARETGWALHGLGITTGHAADYLRAEQHFAEALDVFRDLATWQPAERPRVAAVFADLSWVAAGRGDVDLALARSEAALAEARALGFTWLVGLIMVSLGPVSRKAGNDGRALACYREAMAIGAAQGDRRIIAHALEGVAGVAGARGQVARAARLLGAAAALFERIGVFYNAARSSLQAQELAAIRSALGDATFAAVREAGRALTLEEAVAEAEDLVQAIDNLIPHPTGERPTGGNGLSPREVEVLRLVAAGKTDAEIAEALFLSKRTVGTHLTNILAKLDLANRAEAAAWAVRHGLA